MINNTNCFRGIQLYFPVPLPLKSLLIKPSSSDYYRVISNIP
jgi:hypothetical protein